MGDSYRPGPRRHHYDSDAAYGARASRYKNRDEDEYRADVSRGYTPQLNYDAVDDSDDPYNRNVKVSYPPYKNTTRSDDLRNSLQRRFFDGREVMRVPEGSPPETGEKDVSTDGTALRLLLVRNLKSSITDQLFAKGMEKFYLGHDDLPGGAQPKTLRRVLLIRERRSNQPLGYGFAEYHSVKDAQEAVEKAMVLKHAKKCTIGSSEIKVDFPHIGIFPHASAGVAERNKKYTLKMPGSDHLHKYRDERYYASELFVNEDSPAAIPTVNPNDGASEKKTPKTGAKRGMETLESKAKKSKGPGSSAPALLQHWQNKTAELRGQEGDVASEEPKPPASGVNMVTLPSTSPPTSEEQTFAYDGDLPSEDGSPTKIIGCYLCGSVFGTGEGLIKHLNESKLHESNLKDDDLVQRGYQRLKKKGIDPETTVKLPKPLASNQAAPTQIDSEDAVGKYRDRAAERRQEEGKKIGFSLKSTNKKQTGDNISGSSSDNEPSKPTYGKGLNMLQKAGWSEGQGLGAGGGATAIIDQSLYASGVGLGHESSKKGDAVEEASRMTRNDRGEFLEKTKELARKRYEQME